MGSTRYSRQTVLAQVSSEGQSKISSARVLCIGAGGLGSPALLYLAAAGVGTLGIVDDDEISVSNLQRQILFSSSEVGVLKTVSAQKRLFELNPDIRIETYPERLVAGNVEGIFSKYEIIIDCSDNFSTKFLVNDACVKLGLPMIYGSVLRFEGQIAVFDARRGPCYRCLFPNPPKTAVPNCDEVGVLGAFAGLVGSAQALEALKCILGHPDLPPLVGRLAVLDGAQASWSTFALAKKPDCSVCSLPPHKICLVDLSIERPHDRELDILPEALLLNCLSDPSLRIIDVREPSEFARGFISGAENWPFSKLQEGILPETSPQNKATVIYCQSGIRSQSALQIFLAAGFQRISHLRGGYSDWLGPTSTLRF